VSEVRGGLQVAMKLTVEVRDTDKPALVADCLYRYYA